MKTTLTVRTQILDDRKQDHWLTGFQWKLKTPFKNIVNMLTNSKSLIIRSSINYHFCIWHHLVFKQFWINLTRLDDEQSWFWKTQSDVMIDQTVKLPIPGKHIPAQLWISGLYRTKLIVMGTNDLKNTIFLRIRPQNKRNHKSVLNLLNHHAGCLIFNIWKVSTFRHFIDDSAYIFFEMRISSFRSSKLYTRLSKDNNLLRVFSFILRHLVIC